MSAHDIKVSGIAPSTTEEQIKEFFSFCGKVSSVKVDTAAGSAIVTFEKAAAIATAVLLSDSELNGSKITITAAAQPSDVQSAVADEKDLNEDGDIAQEYKPKATVLAEYLSQGYVLGDKAIARGLDIDKKHGISDKFTSFLSSLDGKYHDTKKDLDAKYDLQQKSDLVKERAAATDKQYGITDSLHQTQQKAHKYLDDALNTETGSKIRSFYSSIVQQVSDVHNEARRLADLKKPETAATSTPTTAPSSGESTAGGPALAGAPPHTERPDKETSDPNLQV